MTDTHTAMCIYQVKPGQETAFESLLARHWPVLHGLELVTGQPSARFRGKSADDSTFYVEFLEWCDQDSAATAHELPEVAAIWEKMGPLCEDRNGRPAMEFPEVVKIEG